MKRQGADRQLSPGQDAHPRALQELSVCMQAQPHEWRKCKALQNVTPGLRHRCRRPRRAPAARHEAAPSRATGAISPSLT